MKKYPQALINVRTNSPMNLDEDTTIQAALRHATQRMGTQGRVLLRASGTEPLIRVMVEGEDEKEVCETAQGLAEVVRGQA